MSDTHSKRCASHKKDICDCDGYHSFDELYDHRVELYITLCRLASESCYVWRSKLHSDGTSFEGFFTLGIFEKPGKQITYHLPLDRWKDTDFAFDKKLGPDFDGHTSDDVLERLKYL